MTQLVREKRGNDGWLRAAVGLTFPTAAAGVRSEKADGSPYGLATITHYNAAGVVLPGPNFNQAVKTLVTWTAQVPIQLLALELRVKAPPSASLRFWGHLGNLLWVDVDLSTLRGELADSIESPATTSAPLELTLRYAQGKVDEVSLLLKLKRAP